MNKTKLIGRANNCISPIHLYSNDNIVLKFWKLIKNMLEPFCLVSKI